MTTSISPPTDASPGPSIDGQGTSPAVFKSPFGAEMADLLRARFPIIQVVRPIGAYDLRMSAAFRRFPRCTALATAALLIGVLWAEASMANTNATLRLVGRVAPQAGIWFSQLLFSFSGMSLAGGRVRLADLGVFGNNRQFTVSLVSGNAVSTGTPSLVDPETGKALPYMLTYDGDPLMFVDGEVQIASGPNAGNAENGLKPLELDMPKRASVDTGRFQERLTIVIAAR